METTSERLRVAIPSKGRLQERALQLLKSSGLRFRISGRQLFATCPETDILLILCNAQDIPGLVERRVVDLGITGSDLVREKDATVTEHMRLGFGKCRLAVAVQQDGPCPTLADLNGRIVGTKFKRLAKQFFADNGIDNVQLLEVNGAIEVMVLLGLVDAIVEIVETGNSLREHDLIEIAEVVSAEAVLIGNDRPRDVSLRDRVLRRIEGVLLAAKYSLVEYNCPAEKLAAAKALTPGFSSPTIQQTGDPNWLAVKVMVPKDGVHTVFDELESIGCQAIIETPVNHCRL